MLEQQGSCCVDTEHSKLWGGALILVHRSNTAAALHLMDHGILESLRLGKTSKTTECPL